MYCTNPKLEAFIKAYQIPGFYIDVCGMYCFAFDKYLLSVFVNSDTDELEVTVDTLSDRGLFEVNLEWETPQTPLGLYESICTLLKKYQNLKEKSNYERRKVYD